MKCDYCKKPAVCNYQDIIVRFPVIHDKKGNYEYGEMETDTDFSAGEEINKHLCEIHEEKFVNDEL